MAFWTVSVTHRAWLERGDMHQLNSGAAELKSESAPRGRLIWAVVGGVLLVALGTGAYFTYSTFDIQ